MPPSLCASNGCAHPPLSLSIPSQTCSRTAFRFVSLINVEPSLSLIASNVNCAKRLANLRRLVGRRASPRVVNVSFRIYIYIRSTLYSRSLFASYTIFPDYLTRSVSNQFHPTISEHYARADYTVSSPLTGIMVRKTRFHSLQLNYRRDACFDRSNFRRHFFPRLYTICLRIGSRRNFNFPSVDVFPRIKYRLNEGRIDNCSTSANWTRSVESRDTRI